jgi:HD-like signal output (HDOD) protein
MLARLIRRFAAPRPDGRSEPRTDAPAPAAPAPVPPAIAAVAPTTAAPPVAAIPPEPGEAELAAALRARLVASCTALADALPAGDPAAEDARLLLADLRGGSDAVIRQPPAAAQEALAAARDPEVDLLQLVRVFERDPLLAQALLRRANSSWYAGGGQCVSLRDAVWRVGLEGVHGVLLASMVEGMLCRPGGEYDTMVAKVWSHMVRTAPIARRLAPAFDVPVDQAFTLALLHDVGKLVVFDRLAALRTQRRRTLHLAPAVLSGVLAELHEPLGGIAALAWGLGPVASRAVATHHRAVRYEGERFAEVLCVAERADLAAARAGTLDLDACWSEAGLSGDRERAQRALLEAAAA